MRDHVLEEAPAPWALQMVNDCLAFGQFPRPGGWHEQDDLEMRMMALAQFAERAFMKQRDGTRWTAKEAEFVAWVGSD